MQRFLFMMRAQLLTHPSCKSFALKQTLVLIEICAFKYFARKIVAKTLWKQLYLFPTETTSKKIFLANCLYVDKTIDLQDIISRLPFGGKIGKGDRFQQKNLKFWKNANFLDALVICEVAIAWDVVMFIP